MQNLEDRAWSVSPSVIRRNGQRSDETIARSHGKTSRTKMQSGAESAQNLSVWQADRDFSATHILKEGLNETVTGRLGREGADDGVDEGALPKLGSARRRVEVVKDSHAAWTACIDTYRIGRLVDVAFDTTARPSNQIEEGADGSAEPAGTGRRRMGEGGRGEGSAAHHIPMRWFSKTLYLTAACCYCTRVACRC